MTGSERDPAPEAPPGAARRADERVAGDLEFVKRTFEKLGRDDPLWAVLSRRGSRHNRWDPEAFFETGRRTIGRVLDDLTALGLTPVPGRALDFGCGVGRLTQALADTFAEVVGIDIAASMVEQARRWNRAGDRVRYLVNAADDLALLDDASFDFVFSRITLQHVPPAAALRYIAEFVRVLKPGGVGMFQVPAGRVPRTAAGRWWYRVQRQHLRRLWKAVRGKPPIEMHRVPRAEVEAALTAAGARIAEVRDISGGRARNFRYCFVR